MKTSKKVISRLINKKNRRENKTKSNQKIETQRTKKQKPTILTVNNSSRVISIKENEYLITYDTKLKYPLLVYEQINTNTGTTIPGQYIDRTTFRDPFTPSLKVSTDKQLTWATYLNSMFLGYSPGHNAPAGNHKTNQETYLKTFELTNMCPQEMVFNSGLWVVFENWSKDLSKFKDLYDINVITGSSKKHFKIQIPSLPEEYFYKLFDNNDLISDTMINEYQKSTKQLINVPNSMFKIILCKHHKLSDNTILFFIIDKENKPYYFKEGALPVVDKRGKDKMKLKLKMFSIHIKQFERKYNLNFNKIVKQVYSRQQKNFVLDNLSKHIVCNYSFPFLIELQMKKSYWYGKLIYATNLRELETNWKELQTYQERFKDLQYHRQYYLLRKVVLMAKNKQVN